jgi:hypothetical protein
MQQLRIQRATALAVAASLSTLAIRCTSFGESPSGEDGGTCERPARAPTGAVVWPTNCHAYLFVRSVGISWDDAEAAARGLDGHLATITSAEENAFIFSILNRELDAAYNPGPTDQWRGPWLGAGRDAGSSDRRVGWAWETGEAFAYAAWHLGEPNNNGNNPTSNENRIAYYGKGTSPPDAGLWADFEGNPSNPLSGYIVEFE